MIDKYDEIDIPIGRTIDYALEVLLYYKKDGKKVKVNFNGVFLYSDTVTPDYAYKKITGMTKEKFFKKIDAYIQHLSTGRTMKIYEITEDAIIFDNGNEITYEHEQDCCENNYADFSQLEDLAKTVNFDENLTFEEIEGYGFRFGNPNGKMFFVPCYSDQNGYYSSDIDILYCGKKVIGVKCKEIETL